MKKITGAIFIGVMVAGTFFTGIMFPGTAFAHHERARCDGQYRCYDEGDDYDQHNHNRRNRGAFSFNGNVVCLPGSTCYTDDREKDPEHR